MNVSKKYIVLVLFVVLVVIGILYMSYGVSQEVPIRAEFETKVVYTEDLSVRTEPLIEDCQIRGGTFNTCGSPCGPTEEICTAVCVYTCEL